MSIPKEIIITKYEHEKESNKFRLFGDVIGWEFPYNIGTTIFNFKIPFRHQWGGGSFNFDGVEEINIINILRINQYKSYIILEISFNKDAKFSSCSFKYRGKMYDKETYKKEMGKQVKRYKSKERFQKITEGKYA